LNFRHLKIRVGLFIVRSISPFSFENMSLVLISVAVSYSKIFAVLYKFYSAYLWTPPVFILILLFSLSYLRSCVVSSCLICCFIRLPYPLFVCDLRAIFFVEYSYG